MSDLIISDIGVLSIPGAAFATVEELEAFVGESLDDARAQHFLDLATAAILNHIDDPTLVANDSVTLDGGVSYLFVDGPVTAVTSITVDGTLVASTNYVWNEAGTIRGVDSYVFGSGIASVVVTFTHGYSIIPDDIKAVCLNIAARAITDEGGSVLSGGIPEARGWGPEVRLRPEEEMLLSRYAPVGIG